MRTPRIDMTARTSMRSTATARMGITRAATARTVTITMATTATATPMITRTAMADTTITTTRPRRVTGRAFALAVGLNVGIVVLQAVYGVLAHSTALLADAGHNLSDVLGLLLAWGAIWLAKRQPSARYTFGLGSSSILASLANAGLLLFACGVIVAEALDRLFNPAPVAGFDVFVVASVGMVGNGFSAWLFMRGQEKDLNIRGAFLHMVADARFRRPSRSAVSSFSARVGLGSIRS